MILQLLEMYQQKVNRHDKMGEILENEPDVFAQTRRADRCRVGAHGLRHNGFGARHPHVTLIVV